MISHSDAKKTASLLTSFSDPTRIRLIEQLLSGPQSVGNLAEAIGVEFMYVSHHLNVLRHAGLVTNEKSGRFVYYRLAEGVFDPDGDTFALGEYRLTVTKGSTPTKRKK